MPSDNLAAKRRAFVGTPGQHIPNATTKYDPTNHGLQIENPSVENPAATTGETSKTVGGVAQLGGLFKPNSESIDPLTGEKHGVDPHGELRGVTTSLQDLNQVLRLMLVELSAQRPSMPLTIEGYTPTQAAHNNDFYFLLDQKRAIATNLFIFNNTGQTIYLAFEEAATPNDVPLPNGSQLPLDDIKIGFFSIYCPVAVAVSRLKNQVKVGNSVVVYAWGNPEWRHAWGQV